MGTAMRSGERSRQEKLVDRSLLTNRGMTAQGAGGPKTKGRKSAVGGEAHVAVFTIGLSPTYLVVIVFKWSQSKTLHAD